MEEYADDTLVKSKFVEDQTPYLKEMFVFLQKY